MIVTYYETADYGDQARDTAEDTSRDLITNKVQWSPPKEARHQFVFSLLCAVGVLFMVLPPVVMTYNFTSAHIQSTTIK